MKQQIPFWTWILIAAIILYYISYTFKKVQQESLLKNIGSDPNALLAQKIHNALNSGFMGWFEDETALYAIGDEITDLTEVSNKYYDMYGVVLANELDRLLEPTELDEFYKHANAKKGTTPTTPSVPTTPTTPTTPINPVGKRIKCIKNVNLREAYSPYAVNKVIPSGTTISGLYIKSKAIYTINNVNYNGYLLTDKTPSNMSQYYVERLYVISSDPTLVQLVI